MRRAAAVLSILLAGPALARPVKTGASTKMSRDPRQAYGHVYWANQISDEITVLAFPGRTRMGDRYDIIDEQGYVGRVIVKQVDETACGDTKYQQAVTSFIGPHARRDATGLMIALGPPLGAPAQAKVLLTDAVGNHALPPAGKANLQPAIDVDGDGVPDLARYVIYNCRTARTTSPDGDTCIETWGREGTSWRLIERAEFPPCY
jgi:hypothetical protein